MDYPLVSVVIPCYNNADYIICAVKSVLEQDYPNKEIIVVDDGSTDNSIDLLRPFYDKITLLQQVNQGPAAARNLGLKTAKGEFIAFNDGDDIWLPGKLGAQVVYLQQHPQTGLCYTNWAVWYQEQPLEYFIAHLTEPLSTAEIVVEHSGWLYTKLLETSVVCTITVMLRAGIIRTVGLFNTKLAIGEDHDYWIRVSRHCQIDKLTGTYAIYRQNRNSTTQKVHAENYSLLVLQSAVRKYGLSCPSGERVSQALVNNYLGARHFSYGYNAMKKGYRKKAFISFKGCIGLRFRLFKAVIFTVICSSPLLYNLFYDKPSKEH